MVDPRIVGVTGSKVVSHDEIRCSTTYYVPKKLIIKIHTFGTAAWKTKSVIWFCGFLLPTLTCITTLVMLEYANHGVKTIQTDSSENAITDFPYSA